MRKPVVSRTMKRTKANICVVNVHTKEVYDMDVTLSRVFKDNNAVQKAVVKSHILPDDVKILSVNTFEYTTVKYVMPEETFIANAQEVK
jgi:hypothetical protein